VSGVVYTDHNHRNNTLLKASRDLFLEMLLMSIWLYRSFPDVDLWVFFGDAPGPCNLSVPVLQYTLIGLDTVQKSKRSNAVQLPGGSTVDVGFLATGLREERPDLPTKIQVSRYVSAASHTNNEQCVDSGCSTHPP
jgi:hypothetical protein